ncbi:MAG: right-handed parallel beta-helix repeat-containing protein [Candidatus Binataceae bacterium]
MTSRTFTLGRIAVFAVAAALMLFAQPALANASTLCVNHNKNNCFATIQSAVNSASAGDTIKIAAGTYNEMVTINTPVNLSGVGKNGRRTVIDATGLAHAIYVTGVTGPMTISAVTAENADRSGILIEASSQISVIGDTVANNDKALSGVTCAGAFPFDQDDCGEGLQLRAVTYSVFASNIIKSNVGGILVTDETGPTHDNQIVGNLVKNNTPDCGITLPSHPKCVGSNSNEVNGCVGGPSIGTPAFGVYNNLVANNQSIGNGAAGTGIFAPTPGTMAYANLIENNVLKNNAQGGVVLHSHVNGQTLNNNVIVGNQISGNGADPDSESGFSSSQKVGIVVFSDATGSALPIVGTTISQNSISNEDIDVLVGTTATAAQVFLNNLRGTTGIANTGSGTIAAIGNFWGCKKGPGTSSCSGVQGPAGSVLTSPFLTKPVR